MSRQDGMWAGMTADQVNAYFEFLRVQRQVRDTVPEDAQQDEEDQP